MKANDNHWTSSNEKQYGNHSKPVKKETNLM